VPRLVLHGLRRTSATLALLAGVQVHVVSQRLGHANVSIALDTYSHVLPQQDGDAARLIGGAIYSNAEVGS
jgi:integrase